MPIVKIVSTTVIMIIYKNKIPGISILFTATAKDDTMRIKNCHVANSFEFISIFVDILIICIMCIYIKMILYFFIQNKTQSLLT